MYRLINRLTPLSGLYQKLGSSATFRPLVWKIKELDNKRYEKQRKKFYSQFIHPNDIVFDIGANIGNRSDVFIALGAQVVAVEPQKYCIDYLANKYKNLPQVTLIQKAVGKTPGKQTLFVSGSDASSSLSSVWIKEMKKSGRLANLHWKEKTQVDITTLDNLIKIYGKPTFCKIDVEGYELEVLQGLSQPIPFVSFEFFPERMRTLISCLKTLQKLGTYTFNFALGEDPHFRTNRWLNLPEIIKAIRALPPLSQGDIYGRHEQEKIRS